MSADALSEHLGYWLDDIKVRAYQTALDEVLTPGARVLDLGSGTGLLGLLAARAGAVEVWSYDYGPVLGTARELAAANGLADRMHFIQEYTTEVALPDVDLVICDQIGGFVFDAGVLEYFADVSTRSLRAGGLLMPSSFEIFAVPVEAPEPYQQVDGWNDRHGFDLSSIRTVAANSWHRIGPTGVSLLADGVLIDERASDDTSRISATCQWVTDRAGTVHGLSGWFNAQLSPSVTLTNHPHDAERMNRWINFHPIETPVAVEQGTPISSTIDIRPEAKFVTWSLQVGDEPEQRMSTFNGQLIFEPRTSSNHLADPPLAHERADLVTALSTAAVDGGSIDELTDTAWQSGLFATRSAALGFARQVTDLLR